MTLGLLNSMFNFFVVFVVVVSLLFFVVFVVVVVLSPYLLSYLLCIHCYRVSFIVVLCIVFD
jgi:hypothetical protein